MSLTMEIYERFIDALEGRALRVHRNGSEAMAQCPAHDDRTASLSIAFGDDGRLLVNCLAGCRTEEVLAAIGWRLADLFERNEHGPQRRAQRPRAAKPERDAAYARARAAMTDAIAAELLQLRGWKPEAIGALGLGFEADRIVFPVRDATGGLVGLLRYQAHPARLNGVAKMLAESGGQRHPFPSPEESLETRST